MKKLLLTCTWLLLLGLTLPIFAADSPAVNDGKWYYVKSQRSADGVGPWWTFTGTAVVPGDLEKTDAQKFTLVPGGEFGKVLIKEFGGTLMDVEGAFNATGAATGWTPTPQTVDGIQGFSFPGERGGLHQGSSGWNWEVRAQDWYDLTDYCIFFFYEADGAVDVETAVATDEANGALQGAIDQANTLLGNAVVGTEGGDYPQAAVDAITTAVAAAQAVADEPTSTLEEINAAATALEEALATFSDARILPFETSTSEAPMWYRIKSATTDATKYWYNKAVYVQADGAMKFKAPELDGSQLFRFEATEGGVKIINQLFPEGELRANKTYGTPDGTVWTTDFKSDPDGLGALQFGLHPGTAGYSYMHMQSDGAIVGWSFNYNNASTLNFESISSEDAAIAAKNAIPALITQANAVYAGSPVGTNPGEYTAEAKAVFQAAIDALTAVNEDLTATEAQIVAAIADYKTASEEFAATAAPIKFSPDGGFETWYKIKCFTRSQPYITDGGIDADVLGSVDSDNDNLLWKFVDMGSGAVNIISKVNGGHVQIPTANSVTLKLLSAPQSLKVVGLGQAQFGVQSSDGARTWHLAGGNNLVTYGTPALNGGGAFLFEEVVNPVLFSETFETYTLGAIGTQNPAVWTGWSGPDSYTAVTTDAQAYEGTQSALIGPSDVSDAVLLLGNKTSDVWSVKWQMYVPTDKTAYFHFQSGECTYEAGVVPETGGAVFSLNLGKDGAFEGDYPEGTWFPVEVTVDLDADIYAVSLDGTVVQTGTYGAELSGIDFYSNGATNEYYLDNLVYANASSKERLMVAIANASTLTDAAVAGTNPGEYPEEAITAMNTAVTDAQTVYDSESTDVELDNATEALLAAMDTFKNSLIPAFETSTSEAPMWYRIVSATTDNTKYWYNKAVYVQADGAMKFKAPELDGSQLFRFEAVEGGVKIINQLFPDGEVLANKTYGTSDGTVWILDQKSDPDGIGALQFGLHPGTAGYTYMHMQSGGAIVGWNFSYNNASTLKFESISSEDAAIAAKNAIPALITQANAIYAGSPVGTNPGEYTEEAKAVFQAAIDALTAVNEDLTATETQVLAAIADYKTASEEFAATAAPIKFSTEGNVTWYKIKCVTRTQPYITDGGIDADVLGSVDSDNDNLLWKIVDMGSGALNIISKVNGGQVEIPTANSVTLKLLSEPQSLKVVGLGQAQFGVQSSDGARTWHLAGGNNLVTYGTPALNGGGAFLFEEYVVPPIIVETFETYTLGAIGTQNPAVWTGWSGPDSYTAVTTDAQAYEGTQSALIGPSDASDAVLLLGNKTTGVFSVKWQMYVPTDKTAYFHFQSGECTYEAGVVSGSSVFSLNLGKDGAFEGDYPEGTWFPVEVTVDLDADIYAVTLDGTVVQTGTYGAELSGIDFYSNGATNEYYLDNLVYANASSREKLMVTIANASTLTVDAVAGTNPGEYPEEAITAMNTAVTDAQTVYDSESTDVELDNATEALLAAMDTFKNSVVPVVTSSTAEAPVWYLIKCAGRGGAGGTIYNNGLNTQLKGTNVAGEIAVDATDLAPKYLFRFEKQDDGKYIIINAAEAGEVLQGSAGGYSSAAITYGTSTDPRTAWNINARAYNETLGTTLVNFVSENNSFWHLDGGYNVVSWADEALESASVFYVEEFAGTIVSLKEQLITAIASAEVSIAKYPVGTNPGEYTEEAKQAYQDVIDAAIATKDNESSSESDYQEAMDNLTAALVTMAASDVAPFKYSTDVEVTWYKIKCATRTQPYITDGGIGSDVLGSVDSNNGNLLWKIVDMGSGAVNIISRTNEGQVEIPTANSTTLKLVSAPQSLKIVGLGQAQFGVQSSDGARTWHLAGGNNLVTYGSPGLDGGGAFLFEEFVEPNSLDNQELNTISVRAIDRMLVVTGTDAVVKAYTISGVEVDTTKALKQGVYIVKVAGITTKVLVQ